jgi:hypothetical protein
MRDYLSEQEGLPFDITGYLQDCQEKVELGQSIKLTKKPYSGIEKRWLSRFLDKSVKGFKEEPD